LILKTLEEPDWGGLVRPSFVLSWLLQPFKKAYEQIVTVLLTIQAPGMIEGLHALLSWDLREWRILIASRLGSSLVA